MRPDRPFSCELPCYRELVDDSNPPRAVYQGPLATNTAQSATPLLSTPDPIPQQLQQQPQYQQPQQQFQQQSQYHEQQQQAQSQHQPQTQYQQQQ